MGSVRLTLLRSLFFEVPPFCGDLLEEHSSHVFPGRNDFILFLEEADAQKRTKLAKRLLSRLARESGLFVPFGLLLEMLRAEEQYAPSTATSQYIPQDHFSHLVQLYLLGLYLFTHHKKFHRTLVSFFKRKRESFTHACSLSSEESAFFDFLFAWRSFVLLHDIGYPCELPPIQGNSLLGEIRTSCVQIRDKVCDETALAFLSRMFAWDQLDGQCSNTSCESVAPSLFAGPDSEHVDAGFLPGMAEAFRDSSLDSWRGATRTPFLHGRRFASLAAHLRSPEEVLALLVHRRSGTPSIALVPEPTGVHRVVNFEKKVRASSTELRRLAFELGKTPRVGSSRHAEYDWEMFFADYEGHKRRLVLAIANIANRHMTPERLHQAAEALAADAPDPLTTITSATDFLAYEHWVYETLQNWWQGIKQTPETTGTVEHSVVSLCTTSVEREIADLIALFFKRRIDATLARNSRSETVSILEDGVEKIVSNAVMPVVRDLDLLPEITSYVETEVQARIEAELTRRRVFEDAKNIAGRVYRSAPRDTEDVDLVSDGALTEALVSSLSATGSHVAAVDGLLDSARLPHLRDLLTNYRPDYLHAGSIDHGLASAVSALRITSFADVLASACSTTSEGEQDRALRSFAAISFCLGDEIGLSDMTYRVGGLMPEVTRTIVMHNLYPKHLADLNAGSFRVCLRREPFCFFAMLCDALQSWDRDRRLWQSETSMPYKTSGDRYDLHIVGDVIHVYEHDNGVDVAQRAEGLKSGLESYLSGVKDYIWLDLGQWPAESQQSRRVDTEDRAAHA